MNLGKGTVTIVDEKEEAAKRQLAAEAGANGGGGGGLSSSSSSPRPGAAVKEREIKLRDNGNVTVAAMTEEDCVEATKLVIDLFFRVRPQDFLAKNRLRAEQAERVYGGLMEGVTQSEDRILLVARISGKVAGVGEMSLPGGARPGAETLEPRAPPDAPYVSDVAVAPNQRGRGIGRALLRACEAAAVAKGHGEMYVHVKMDNEAGLALFEKGGYREPAEAAEGSTPRQSGRRGAQGGVLATLGLVEVGHLLLAKELRAKDYA